MFVVVAPFFNTSNTPARVKVGFSAIVALLLYFVVDFSALDYTTVVGYAFLVVREAVTGLIIGFSTYCCNFIIFTNKPITYISPIVLATNFI